MDVLVSSDVVAVFIGGDTSFVFLDAHWTRCMVGQLFSVTPEVANRRPASLDHRRLLKEDDRVLQNVWLDKTGYAGFPRTELLRIVTMVDSTFFSFQEHSPLFCRHKKHTHTAHGRVGVKVQQGFLSVQNVCCKDVAGVPCGHGHGRLFAARHDARVGR